MLWSIQRFQPIYFIPFSVNITFCSVAEISGPAAGTNVRCLFRGTKLDAARKRTYTKAVPAASRSRVE